MDDDVTQSLPAVVRHLVPQPKFVGTETVDPITGEKSFKGQGFKSDSDVPLYPVGSFCRTVVKHPVLVMVVCFVVSIACSVVGFATAGGFSGSFTDLSDPIVRTLYGGRRASYDWALEIAGVSADDGAEDDLSTAARQTVEMAVPIQIILHSKKGEALGTDALEQFAYLQNEVVKFKGFSDYCLRSASDTSDASCRVPSSPIAVANYASNAEGDGATGGCACSGAFGVSCARFDSKCSADFGGVPTCDAEARDPPASEATSAAAFSALCASSSTAALNTSCDASVYSLRLDTVGKNWDCATQETKWARLLIPYGLPFEAGETDEDLQSEMREDFEAELVPHLYALKAEIEGKHPDLTVYLWGLDQIPYYLNNDLRMVVLAIFFVYLMLWWQTDSLFVSSCGLFEIIISYPLGLFVWHAILRQPYVTYLMYSGIFVILGIGADDIFVLSDAFKQSAYQPPHISGSLETRFAWAYNRAASAMFATSLTTCAAFASCAAT